MNGPVVAVGIGVIFLGFLVMAIHPRQRGSWGWGSRRSSGPGWYTILILGIIILALGAGLPG
jgi:hypothetical protein